MAEEQDTNTTTTSDTTSFLSTGLTSFSRLRYPALLQEVENINQDYSVGISKVGVHEAATSSGDTTVDIDLPRIVVIGDESAGKSSTLERIAMADVLPRNTGICTRQPIVLKLRHDPDVDHRSPKLKLTIPGEGNTPKEVFHGLTCAGVREKIRQHMLNIARNSGMVIAKEIVVESNCDRYEYLLRDRYL